LVTAHRPPPHILSDFHTSGESTKFLAGSTYIRDLAVLVIAYGMSINIVEVTWKSKLKAAFPNPNEYSGIAHLQHYVRIRIELISVTLFSIHG
jgi:ATP/ADP translocase